MDYFFGYNTHLDKNIDWFFNGNHLFLILFVASLIVTWFFLFHAKSEKGKKITKICLAVTLFVLEIGRIIYKYTKHIGVGNSPETFDWWWTISFQMCAIMCWTTIVTLLLSAFLKKDNKFLQVLYNILFGCGMIGGIATFCYPDCLSANLPFLHFVNIQTVLVHSLLIFVPIYFIKTKDFVVDIKNFWKVFVGYVYIGSVAMTASLISGKNFAFSIRCDLVDFGLPFPWHLPILMIILSMVSLLIYGCFELVKFLKNKKQNNSQIKLETTKEKPNKLDLAISIVSNVMAVFGGMMILLSIASLIGDKKTMLGLFCLLPLIYMILMLVFSDYYKNKLSKNLNNNDSKHIIFIVLTFIFALPVGIIYLVKYLQDNSNKLKSINNENNQLNQEEVNNKEK